MRLSTLISALFCLSLVANYSALAAPVSKGRPARLAADWLREGNDRLGKKMDRKLQAEIPYRNEAGDVIFYAVPLATQGVIIVSSDDLIEPVIAFSDCATTNDLTGDSPLLAFLNRDLTERNKHAASIETLYAAPAGRNRPDRAAQFGRARENKTKWEKHAKSAKNTDPEPTAADATTEPIYGGSNTISDIRIAPIISSRWNQQTAQSQICYNYYTPGNYYAGCVAIAMAQVMRYWQYPSAGLGQLTRTIYVNGTPQSATTRGGDGVGGAYNWNQMPLNPQTATYNLAQWQMIGAVCYDAGVIASMDYTPTGSSATLLLATRFTQVLGYGNARDFWVNGGIPSVTRDQILMSNLAAGYPVITGIRQSSSGSGHAIVADGLGYSGGVAYYHVNYGWGLSGATAWYNMPNMDSSPSYNVVDVLIYNIFPTNTGEIVSGRITDSNGGLQGVSITLTAAGTNYTATTDTNGYYGLIVPSGKTYALSAAKTGYASGQIASVVVGTSSTSYSGPCGNAFAQDLALTSSTPIPTLGEWGMIIFMVFIILFGAQTIRNQHSSTKTGTI